MPGELHLELVCRADSAAEFARLARLWLTEGLEDLFPEYAAGMAADPPLKGKTPDEPEAPWGPPGVVYAAMWVRKKPSAFGGSYATYSGRAFQRLLSGLESAYPFHIHMWMHPLDEHGLPLGGEEVVEVGVHRLHDNPEWVQLEFEASAYREPWPGSTDIQGKWIEFLRRWSERLDACYGHISDDASSYAGTALERATDIEVDETIPQCREVLRGYSWVTLCAPEIAERLGGVAVLLISGVFHEVSELPGGQVLMRATPMLEGYEGIAVTHVFEVLAPVLLAGRADPAAAIPGSRLVMGVDAADFR